MENTHLSRLLETLTPKELKLLKKWVASPFFNQRMDVIELLDLYSKRRKKQQTFPSKLEIFHHLYPNESFDDHRIRMVMSFLNRQVERFLIHQKQQEKLLINKLTLLPIYRERGLQKSYKRVAKEVEKTFDQTTLRNADYYRLKLRFLQEQNKIESSSNRYEHKNSLQAISDNLDLSIFLEKIREGINILAHEEVATINYDSGIFENLLTILQEKSSFLKNPAIATYYAAYLTISHLDEYKYVRDYLQLLERNQSIFDREELLDFYSIALINLMRRFNQGERKYTSDVFTIYQKKVQLNLYEHKITHYHFKNIVAAGLDNGAYDWIEQFIVDYGPKLDKVHQNMLTKLGQSALAQRRGQYKKALQLLEQTKFEDVNHNISARFLKGQILYNLKDWDALQKHLKAYEIYIRRLTKAQYSKKKYLDFILFAQKVFRLNHHDKIEKQLLLEKLKSSNFKYGKEWLIECLNNKNSNS